MNVKHDFMKQYQNIQMYGEIKGDIYEKKLNDLQNEK